MTAQLGDLATRNEQLLAQLAQADADRRALAAQVDNLASRNTSLQTELNQMSAASAALTTEVTSLTTQKQLLQGQLTGIGDVLQVLTESLQESVNSPMPFRIPGETLVEQEQNLVNLLIGLPPGPKLLLYSGLGGTK